MTKLATVGCVLLWTGVAAAQDAAPEKPVAAGGETAASAAAAPLPAGRTPYLERAAGSATRTFGGLGDGERTLGALPRNVARGIVGVLSRDNLTPLLVGTSLSFTSSGFDEGTARLIRNDCRPCGTTGAKAGGVAVVPAIGALFLAGRLSSSGRFRAFSYDMAEAAVVDTVWAGALKYSLQRTRPDRRDRLSFPSGHTSTAFSLATVTERHYGWKAGIPAYAIATFIGYSRIERNRHHLSDVIAGATLGVIVGRTVTRLNGGVAGRRSLSIGPASDANGGGIGLGVSASW